MLSLTRKADYALAALAALARRGRAIASARDLSDQLRIPPRALTNVLNLMAQNGLVVSVRGAHGGYGLARPPAEITLTELFEAVEGPTRLARCCPGGAEARTKECELEGHCEIREPVYKLNFALRDLLSQVTVEDMAWNRVNVSVAGLATGSLAGGG